MIEYLTMTKSLATSATNNNFNCDEIHKLLELFEKRLQVILKTLAKLCLISASGGPKKAESERMATNYKTLFGATLQRRPASTAEDVANGNNVIKEYALHLVNMMQKICDLDKIDA